MDGSQQRLHCYWRYNRPFLHPTRPDLNGHGGLSTAPAASLGSGQTIAAGSALELSTRYGDYFWAATQPKTPNTFWVSGEFRQVQLFQGWSTEIGLVTFNPF